MATDVLVVQRFYYNFREGFFEYLYDNKINFKLINATVSRGRVRVHDNVKHLPYIHRVPFMFMGKNHVVFPFLFFSLIRINPGIVVTEGGQNTINNIAVFLYCKLFRKPYIIWDLGKGYADFGNSFLRKSYMSVYKFILKSAFYIFGYNSQSKEYFLSLGVNENKIIVLNNTIDTRKIEKIKKNKSQENTCIPGELKDLYNRDLVTIIFVGTLLPTKNIESLATIMKNLGKDYLLIIVGDGDKNYLDELKVMFKGTNHVFTGYKRLEELVAYYKLASFAILPGLGGLSINQAMAYGVPVLCREADGAEKDLIINDQTGYIFKDIDDVCPYIISKTKSDWHEMGHAAKELLFTEHSVESMMSRFVNHCNLSKEPKINNVDHDFDNLLS